MNEKIENQVSRNLANYAMLPLLKLNKSSFGVDNFINCFVDKQGFIVVNTKTSPVIGFTNHENYATDFENQDGTLMIVYYIPEEFKSDLECFIRGAFSEYSADAKVRISKYSGLKEKDYLFKCLSPTKEDRQAKADELGVRVDLIKELRSAPSDNNFIKIK